MYLEIISDSLLTGIIPLDEKRKVWIAEERKGRDRPMAIIKLISIICEMVQLC